MHHNSCDFTKSTLLTTKNPTYKHRTIQATTCASTTSSYETSTSNMLPNYKCTFSTFETNKDCIYMGAIDGTSSSTPPTLSTNNTPFQPLTKKNLNTKNEDTRHKKNTKGTFQALKNKKDKVVNNFFYRKTLSIN
jgi:hypothetical protein